MNATANDLRPVSVAGMEMQQLAQQPAPQLMWVKIEDLVIDDRYQRPLNGGNWASIKRIAKDFRWSRFSPVMVAPVEGGRYALIDGQHRAHAAALCGVTSIPAMVALVAPEEQALAFIEINTRQIKVHGLSVYRAALSAGEDWAVNCRDAVHASGCVLMTSARSSADKKPGQIFTIELIRRLVEAGHARAVSQGLSALMKFAPDSLTNFQSAVLTPWLWAVSEHQTSTEALHGVLLAKQPSLVMTAADRLAAEDGVPKATARRQFFSMLIRREGRP